MYILHAISEVVRMFAFVVSFITNMTLKNGKVVIIGDITVQ